MKKAIARTLDSVERVYNLINIRTSIMLALGAIYARDG